ncbi:MAG: prepilin-type N-terminal cleavage/methylation domain-containing protein [Deltaproteobacteria bacterium]|nr:prepilin-type N-terminal cleavage/methylation domain-containing protein [Deltaproteobacteria bacterium]
MKARGFTLIETVLTLLVVGIGLFGIMALYQNMSYSLYNADLQVIATDFAQQKVEQLVAKKAFSGYGAVTSEAAEILASGPHNFTRTTTVEYIDPTTMAVSVADTGYKRVMIDVTWGLGLVVRLVTLVTNQVPLL